MTNLSSFSRAAQLVPMRLLYNYTLQPSGAIVRVVIAVRVLQVQTQSALSRAFERIARS